MHMDEIIQLAMDRTQARGLTLILTKDKARTSKTDLIGVLLLNGPLFVVSGDEWLPAFALPRRIRKQTTDVKTVMDRLRSVRASTCYRLFDSLASLPSKGELLLVIDFLHTFYDADIPLRTRLFCLRECCRELKRLAFYRPVILMTQEMEGEEYPKLVPALFPTVDKIFTLEHEPEPILQPILF